MSINIVDRCIFVNIAITSENKNEVGGLKTLFFEHSMNSHSKKAFLNLIVLARIAPYMEKKNSYESISNITNWKLSFCLDLSQQVFNNEQALKLTYGDKSSLLQDLLRKDEKNSVFVHHIIVFLSYTLRFQIFRSFFCI